MSTNMNDRLFRFLRSRLRNAESRPEDWNTPPDAVFENAMVELGKIENRNRRRRTAIVLWTFAGLGVLAVLTALMIHINGLSGKIETLENRISDIHSVDDNSSGAILEDQSNTIESGSVLSEDDPRSSEHNSQMNYSSATNRQTGVTVSSGNTTGPLYDNQDSPGTRSIPAAIAIPESSVDEHSKNTLPDQPADGKSTGGSNDHADLSFLAHSIPSVLRQNDQAITGIDIHPQETGIAGSSRWSLGFRGSLNLTSLNMTGVGQGPPILTEYDHFYIGGGAEILGSYSISKKWSLDAGLSYSRLRNKSTMQDFMLYDEDNLITDGQGNTIYSTECKTETPLGYYLGLLQFDPGALNPQNGETISNTTGIDQKLDIWSVSLGVRYDFLAAGRTRVFAGAGGTFSGVSHSVHNMHTDLFMYSEYLAGMDLETDRIEMQASTYTSLYGEVGWQYDVTKKFSLLFNLRYSHSVTSLRLAQNQGPKTYARQVILGAGGVFHF